MSDSRPHRPRVRRRHVVDRRPAHGDRAPEQRAPGAAPVAAADAARRRSRTSRPSSTRSDRRRRPCAPPGPGREADRRVLRPDARRRALTGGAGIGGAPIEVDSRSPPRRSAATRAPRTRPRAPSRSTQRRPSARRPSQGRRHAPPRIAAAINAPRRRPSTRRSSGRRRRQAARPLRAQDGPDSRLHRLHAAAAALTEAAAKARPRRRAVQARRLRDRARPRRRTSLENAIPGAELTLKAPRPTPRHHRRRARRRQGGRQDEDQGLRDAYNAVVTTTRAKIDGEDGPDADDHDGRRQGRALRRHRRSAACSPRCAARHRAVPATRPARRPLRHRHRGAASPADLRRPPRAARSSSTTPSSPPRSTPTRPGSASCSAAAASPASPSDIEGRRPARRRRARPRVESLDAADRSGITDAMAPTDTRLQAKEKRLKAQFAAMETALPTVADAAGLALGPARLAQRHARSSRPARRLNPGAAAADHRDDPSHPLPRGLSCPRTPAATPAAYQQHSVMTASPGQLVVMLYDGACGSCTRPRPRMREGATRSARAPAPRARRSSTSCTSCSTWSAAARSPPTSRASTSSASASSSRPASSATRTQIDQVAELLGELREAWAQIAAREPWQDLLALAERELALAREGRWEELAAPRAPSAPRLAAAPAAAPAPRRAPCSSASRSAGAARPRCSPRARAETARELGR